MSLSPIDVQRSVVGENIKTQNESSHKAEKREMRLSCQSGADKPLQEMLKQKQFFFIYIKLYLLYNIYILKPELTNTAHAIVSGDRRMPTRYRYL